MDIGSGIAMAGVWVGFGIFAASNWTTNAGVWAVLVVSITITSFLLI